MFGSSRLNKELTTWMKKGGDLDDALTSRAYKVSSKKEASTIVAAIGHFQATRGDADETGFSSSLHRLAAFFQRVDSREAFEVLARDGLPLLRREIERALAGEGGAASDALFIMKILAMYQQEEDIGLIVRAARSGYESDGYMWSVVFGTFGDDHPHVERLIDALREPLPESFMGVAFLDLCNGLAIDAKLERHPFAAQNGVLRLRKWLEATDPEDSSYAHSATAALPFVAREDREGLLSVAKQHSDAGVRIEAAWASAKSGDPSGLAALGEFCRDPNHSAIAQQYLSELGAADEIPEECRDPDFRAVAEMANWLAHPNEFGRPPTSVELFDSRNLYWSPTDDSRQVWLVKYRYEEPGEDPDVGLGMVGSVTFALFGETTADLSAEDIYGLHCCWELEGNEDPRAPEERTAAAGRAILATRNEGF